MYCPLYILFPNKNMLDSVMIMEFLEGVLGRIIYYGVIQGD